MSIFEGELRDSRFVELTEPFRHHAVVIDSGAGAQNTTPEAMWR